MPHYYPDYYVKFRCIAADCPDSCCQGWDVVIDSDTEAFYNSVQGRFGDSLRSAIYTDGDGDRVFRLAEKKKCPFWGSDKLCDIYKELGEEHLCATCARFPRLSMDYTVFTEHTLSLACPEAARLILAENSAYASFTQETAAECEDYDSGIMNLLLQTRRRSADILTDSKPLSDRLREYLLYNQEVQNSLYPQETPDAPYSADALASLYAKLEYIDNANRKKIVHACQTPVDCTAPEAELTRLGLYYLYRYYLNAIDTLDVLTPAKLMLCSVIVISSLAQHAGINPADAAQLYSKEIEQSYENMELLYDAFAYDSRFSVENLLRLLQESAPRAHFA